MRRPTASPDQAVILTLLDSCVRASKLCAFHVGEFDPKRGKREIRHGIAGGAEAGKGSVVYQGRVELQGSGQAAIIGDSSRGGELKFDFCKGISLCF